MAFGKAFKIGAGVTCGGCAMIILIIGGLYALGDFGAKQAKARQESRQNSGNNTQGETGSSDANLAHKWTYKTQTDKMDSSITKFASIISTNTFELDFPHRGEQNGKLTIRGGKRSGVDVMFSVDKGQIMSGINDGSLLIRFDSNKPQKFFTSKPSDHSSNVVFINNYTKFIQDIKLSKKLLIEVEFYNNGTKTLEFDTDGLQWN